MMYHTKATRIVGAVLAAFGLLVTLTQLHTNVAATNTSLPFHLQRPVEGDLQASVTKANGKIAFSRPHDHFLFVDIFVMEADGSNQRQLTFGSRSPTDTSRTTQAFDPVWSPDGTKIAFSANLEYG